MQRVKQSVLSVEVGMKIARSRDLGIQATCKHMNLLNSAKKTGFNMLEIVWHGLRASQIVRFDGHAYRPCLLQAMCFCSSAQLALEYVGKGCQQTQINAAPAAPQMQRVGYERNFTATYNVYALH